MSRSWHVACRAEESTKILLYETRRGQLARREDWTIEGLMVIKEMLLKLGGWRAPFYFGGAADVDRWRWLASHALHGPIRTLDAGCGAGSHSFHAAKAGNEVVAMSFDAPQNEKAHRRAKVLGLDKINFMSGDLRELDSLAENLGLFDQIYCMEVIEHLKNDAKLIRDLSAMLKPGGRILLSAPYKFHRPNASDIEVSGIEDGRHVRFGYTPKELAALLEQNGLEVQSVDLITGLVCQKIDHVFGTIRRWINRDVAWVVSFPLRILQGLDGPLTRLTGWPALSVAIVAKKPSASAIPKRA